jgi:hypothetical protein
MYFGYREVYMDCTYDDLDEVLNTQGRLSPYLGILRVC